MCFGLYIPQSVKQIQKYDIEYNSLQARDNRSKYEMGYKSPVKPAKI